MFYGVEKSTDMRDPRTKVKPFRNEKALKKWMMGGGGFTHENPDEARNHHHTLRYGYNLPGGLPRKIEKPLSSPDYPRTMEDGKEDYLYRHAETIFFDI